LLKVFQCVRKFSPYGGMESYVWNLAHELIKKNIKVIVLCEEFHNDFNDKIEVVVIHKNFKKIPPWISHLLFSQGISKFLQNEKELGNEYVIHSHERLSMHDITTIHGPLILDRKKRMFDFLSLRLLTWKYLEKREFFSDNVKCIVPNSEISKRKIKHFYPLIKAAICSPGYPGTNKDFYKIENKSKIHNFGFIGKEWKRKGLLFVIDVFKEIYKYNPTNIHLHIAAVDIKEVKKFLEGLPESSYTFYWWIESVNFYEKTELLIHPALNEPFGMVVAEANASGVYCLISKNVGFRDFISPNVGEVLELDKKIWVDKILSLIGTKIHVKRVKYSWSSLSDEYLKLYRMINKSNSN